MAYTNTSTNSNSSGTSASLQNVKDDLNTLKTDVVDLGTQAKEDGKKRLENTAANVQAKISDIKAAGTGEIENLKTYVAANPTQSIGYAFAAGFALSLLLARR